MNRGGDKTHKRHERENERGSRFDQTVTDPQLVCTTVTLLLTGILRMHPSMRQPVEVHTMVGRRGHGSTRSSGNRMQYTTRVPSMSSSCPWLPSRVRDRKGAKSTKVSLSRGATFSKALSSFVVMLSKKTHRDGSHKRKLDARIRVKNLREGALCPSIEGTAGKEQ